MPEMNGLELATQIGQIRPDIPVILCTGYSNVVDEMTATAHGIKELVRRPFSMDTLATLVRRKLDAESTSYD